MDSLSFTVKQNTEFGVGFVKSSCQVEIECVIAIFHQVS